MSQRSSLAIADGFNGRIWLTHTEWETYRRRVAVRYPQKVRQQVAARDGAACCICGGREREDRPIQLAHRVPFKLGVVDWGLTPDWLDGIENLCLAHRGACNDGVELKTEQIPGHLRNLGLRLEDSPAVSSGHLVLLPNEAGYVVKFHN